MLYMQEVIAKYVLLHVVSFFLRKMIVKYFKLNAPIFGQADYCIRSAYSGERYSTTEKWA